MNGRISKGFHRAGVVAALLIFIIFGIALALQNNGVSIWHWIVIIVACLVIYIVLRLVGWIVNGFTTG